MLESSTRNWSTGGPTHNLWERELLGQNRGWRSLEGESTFTRDIANDVIKGIGCRDAKTSKKHNHESKTVKSNESLSAARAQSLIDLANIRYDVSYFTDSSKLRFFDFFEMKVCKLVKIQIGKLLRCGELARSVPGLVGRLANPRREGAGELSDVEAGLGLGHGPGTGHFGHGSRRFSDQCSPFLVSRTNSTLTFSTFDFPRRRSECIPHRFVWFEEYPFEEGLFVLNGFMYVFIGLLDLSTAPGAPEETKNEAQALFKRAWNL